MRTLPYLLLAVLSLTPAAYAEEFVVTQEADTADGSCDLNDCSLREAVIAANALVGDDRITIPAGTYVLTTR